MNDKAICIFELIKLETPVKITLEVTGPMHMVGANVVNSVVAGVVVSERRVKPSPWPCYQTQPGSSHLMHSKAKLLTLDAGKGGYSIYCKMPNKNQARRMCNSCSKDTNSPVAFMEGFLKATLGARAKRCPISLWTFSWLADNEVTGWYFQS